MNSLERVFSDLSLVCGDPDFHSVKDFFVSGKWTAHIPSEASRCRPDLFTIVSRAKIGDRQTLIKRIAYLVSIKEVNFAETVWKKAKFSIFDQDELNAARGFTWYKSAQKLAALCLYKTEDLDEKKEDLNCLVRELYKKANVRQGLFNSYHSTPLRSYLNQTTSSLEAYRYLNLAHAEMEHAINCYGYVKNYRFKEMFESHPTLKNDREAVLFLANKSELVLEYASKKLLETPSFVRAWLNQRQPKINIYFLSHLPKVLRKNKDVVLYALRQPEKGWILAHQATRLLPDDQEVGLEAIRVEAKMYPHDATCVENFSERLKKDSTFYVQALEIEPKVMLFWDKNYRFWDQAVWQALAKHDWQEKKFNVGCSYDKVFALMKSSFYQERVPHEIVPEKLRSVLLE